MNGIEISIGRSMDDAEQLVRRALGEVGFGVLTEIDVAATLQAKLGLSRPPLKILGACNPSFAQRALELDPSLALLLPCNVVLEDEGEGHTRVTIADPRALLATGQDRDSPELRAFGDEAATALEETAAKLKAEATSKVVRVEHKGGDLFEAAVRQHVVQVDQPIEDGGSDVAPTPTELFVASLASCVAFYVRRYLARHGLRTEGLSVAAIFTMAERPARVGGVTISVTVPGGVPEERRAALLAVASRCTVHNSLERPPEVSLELAS